jgi:dihydroorotate dehydrogenase (NAD+) catalytic subunit
LPFLETLVPPAIANIYGKTVEEYALLAQRLEPFEAVKGTRGEYLLPNVKEGGVVFGSDPKSCLSKW